MGEKVSSRSIRGDSSLRKDSHKRNLTVGFNSAMTHHAAEPVKAIPGNYDLNTVSSPIFGYEEQVEPSFAGGGARNHIQIGDMSPGMTTTQQKTIFETLQSEENLFNQTSGSLITNTSMQLSKRLANAAQKHTTL